MTDAQQRSYAEAYMSIIYVE